VIGFADGIWSRRLTPSLSTISQHGPEIGAAAAKLLIDEIEAKQKGEKIAPQKVIIRTELRKRDSVKK
jgi:LacI family transcriptional regulator